MLESSGAERTLPLYVSNTLLNSGRINFSSRGVFSKVFLTSSPKTSPVSILALNMAKSDFRISRLKTSPAKAAFLLNVTSLIFLTKSGE